MTTLRKQTGFGHYDAFTLDAPATCGSVQFPDLTCAPLPAGSWVMRGSNGRVFCPGCAAFIAGVGEESERWLSLAGRSFRNLR